jgi:cell division protein FtsI/penicillin-binding protein 2
VTARVVNRRLRLLVAVFVLAFGVVLVRAGYLQAVRGGSLDKLAANQHRETISIPARRGTFFDRSGVELAIGERAVTVYANPQQVEDPRQVAIAAGRALDIKPEKLYALLTDRSKGFVYLQRQADPQKAEMLRDQDLPGVGFYPEERRIYPLGDVASEVVGYAGVDNKGLAGLELSLDKVVGGVDGEKTVVRDPIGHELEVVNSKDAENGQDVYLTIDNTLQRQVERILQETRRKWNAVATTAVILDPRTGGILAMAVEPGFDANKFSKVPRDRQRNRAVTDTYEPGSTFKVVTVTGALETGMVTPSTKYTLAPTIDVADRTIHDAEPRGTQTMTVSQIISHSSNVGVVTLALGLGRQTLADWIDRFGFGHVTGVEYPGETPGIVVPPEQWSGSTIGNVPIGHGIAVTPLQMASAYAAIANDGVEVSPHLVERVVGGSVAQPKRRRVLAAKTAEQVTRMLRGVVDEGSGIEAHVPGYKVAGKTGTAAKPDPVNGGYSESRYVASFVGFAPIKNPRFVALVTVDEPRGTIWGGTAAAPAFREIAEFALQYFQVPPDVPSELGAG